MENCARLLYSNFWDLHRFSQQMDSPRCRIHHVFYNSTHGSWAFPSDVRIFCGLKTARLGTSTRDRFLYDLVLYASIQQHLAKGRHLVLVLFLLFLS